MKTSRSLLSGRLTVTSAIARRETFPLIVLGAGLVLVPFYSSDSDILVNTSSVTTALPLHTVALPYDQVFVAGGRNDTGSSLTSGSWTATGSLGTPRYHHTATLLPNGQVLVAGGDNGTSGSLASAELYDSASGAWTATGSLITGRESHTATLLYNG